MALTKDPWRLPADSTSLLARVNREELHTLALPGRHLPQLARIPRPLGGRGAGDRIVGVGPYPGDRRESAEAIGSARVALGP